MAQLKEQVSGISEQIEAKAQEIALIEEELKGVLELWKKQPDPDHPRDTALKRDAARLGGERGQLIAAKAEAGGKICRGRAADHPVDQDIRSKVAEELSEVRAKISELERAQDRRRGPTEAHRYSRTANRPGTRACGAHGWWGDHSRRNDHADRARQRRLKRSGEGLTQ